MGRKKTVVAVVGGFDPVHVGHIRNFREAKKLGDELWVILQSDEWLINKKGYVFMPYNERKEILEAIRYVDKVVPAIGTSPTCEASLEYYRPDIFAKGGDRTPDNMEQIEVDTCRRLGIKIAYNVGGGKVQSSSWLIDNVVRTISERYRSRGE